MEDKQRRRFWQALAECPTKDSGKVLMLIQTATDSATNITEREQATSDLLHILFANFEETTIQKTTHEASFAVRLKELMAAKHLSQRELAERVGCTQPAISLMLQRSCRPQKKTILKLAEALHVHPQELWPDLDLADMLDAVVSFQQDDYVMTPAEESALSGNAKKNRAKIQPKRLPPRP